MQSSDLTQAHDHCQQLVRKWDNDRYLAGVLAPEDKRGRLWALYAFDYEVARIRSTVTDPAIGEIRYQWWHDAVTAIYEKSEAEHPVIVALAEAIEKADLPRHAFINLIEARRFDIYDDPMPSLNDLEGYLGETYSVLMQMAARVLCGEAAFGLSDVTGPAGVAYGLCRLMCQLPVYCARGQCYLPIDMLEKYQLTSAHVISGRREQGVDVVLSELRHHTRRRMLEARERVSIVPVTALPALWPSSLVELYLQTP